LREFYQSDRLLAVRDARFYASNTDLDAKNLRCRLADVTMYHPAYSMQIVNETWLTAFRRIRQQHRVPDLFHFLFGRSLEHPTHTNARSLKKCSITRSINKLTVENCEALHLRFVLDNMHLACEDSQVGPCPISVLCDPLTW
jgi:hypothetical protein